MQGAASLEHATLIGAADILRAVAHPLRLRTLEFLEDGQPRRVYEIQSHLGVKQSVASTQLALLRDRGVLGARRDGVQIYYTLIHPAVPLVLDCIRRHRDNFLASRPEELTDQGDRMWGRRADKGE